jgi:hypothetical protein
VLVLLEKRHTFLKREDFYLKKTQKSSIRFYNGLEIGINAILNKSNTNLLLINIINYMQIIKSK